MNREALFCDGTGDYVCPAEPEINEKVVLRFRTAHNDVDEVKLHIGEQEYPMWKTRTDGEFDFYEIEYQLGKAGFRRLGRRWRRTAPDSRMPVPIRQGLMC